MHQSQKVNCLLLKLAITQTQKNVSATRNLLIISKTLLPLRYQYSDDREKATMCTGKWFLRVRHHIRTAN